MTKNTQMIYSEIPVGAPIPGKTIKLVDSELDIDNCPLHGGFLLKVKALSLDPYMRGRMRDPRGESYNQAFEVSKPLNGLGVGEVIRSDAPNFPVGACVTGLFSYGEYAVVPAALLGRAKVLENKEKLSYTTLIGGIGMPSQTAYWSFYNIGKPVKGETIFVSAASGAVGQIVCQLAKREGLKVIASAGSDAKVDFVKSLGADVAWNYKTEDTAKMLSENKPDIFFDNVGGETLDQVLLHINDFGRIIACGSVSQYNLTPEQKYRLLNYQLVVTKQLTYQGFIISGKDLAEFWRVMPALVASGEIKVKEHVTQGLDEGQSSVDMLNGTSFGKAVISLE